MSMFDYVFFEMRCPKCDTKVTEFQSKDKSCALQTLNYWEVENFYGSCDNCGLWIEFDLRDECKRKYTIKDYKMTTRQD